MGNLLERLRKSEYAVYLSAALAGALVFVMLHGVKILNPLYIDWLMSTYSDLTQHYLGWVGYRNADWSFPVGLMDTLSYPNPTSIIFTDSIPLFAVFFKLISFLLPETFQYFGLWGLLCFMLQPVMAVRILKRFSSSPLFLLFSATLLTVSPALIDRMYVHTALASHWMIFLALEPVFNYKSYRDAPRHLYLHAAVLGLLSPAIHMYYLLMSGMILAGLCLLDLLHRERFRRSSVILGTYLLCALCVTALLGGFSGGAQAGTGGLGEYSFNLNSFFNPIGRSSVLPNLPMYYPQQYEGFAYLGAGCLLALLAALLLLPGFSPRQHHWKSAAVFLALILISVVCALSPVITFNDRCLLRLELPELIIRFWSIFRATGRLSWVAYSLITLLSLAVIAKLAGPRPALILVIVCLCLQIYDLHPWVSRRRPLFSDAPVWENRLDDAVWDGFAADDSYRHVVFCTDRPDSETLYYFGDWATRHDKTLNTFNIARNNISRVRASINTALDRLSPDNIYVFFEDDLYNCAAFGLHCYEAGEYTVGTVRPVEGLKELTLDEPVTWVYPEGLYLSPGGGYDEEQRRTLHPGGFSFGPYMFLPAGSWEIFVEGEGLDCAKLRIYSQLGQHDHPFTVTMTSQGLKIGLSLTEAVDDLEIYFENVSGIDLKIGRFSFQPAADSLQNPA